MTIIAIILSLLIVGTICTLLLYFLLSIKQKKISSEVGTMLDNIDKRKEEIKHLDQKVTEALSYLSKMQPLDLALELEEKIKSLKKKNETENLNIASFEEKQKAVQEQLQNFQAEKQKKSLSNANNNITTTKYEVNNNQINALEVSDQEIDFNSLAEELADFIKKTEALESKDKETLQEAEMTLGKFQGHISFLIETYNTTSKRVAGLDAQYQELQKEYQKLLNKAEEDKGSTK